MAGGGCPKNSTAVRGCLCSQPAGVGLLRLPLASWTTGGHQPPLFTSGPFLQQEELGGVKVSDARKADANELNANRLVNVHPLVIISPFSGNALLNKRHDDRGVSADGIILFSFMWTGHTEHGLAGQNRSLCFSLNGSHANRSQLKS